MGYHIVRYLQKEKEKRKLPLKYLFKRTLVLLSPFKYSLILLLVLSIIGICLNLMIPYITKLFVDAIVIRDINSLVNSAIIFIIVATAGLAVNYTRSYLVPLIGQRLMLNLRNSLYRHVLTIKLDYFSRTPTGKIVSRIMNDVDSIGEILASGAIDVLSDFIFIAGAMFIMFSLSIELTLIVAITVLIVVIIAFIWGERARKIYRKVRESIAEVTSKIEQDVSGVLLLHTFIHRRADNIMEFQRLSRKTLTSSISAAKVVGSMGPVIRLIEALCYILILWYGSHLVGVEKITIGTLSAFYGYVGMLFRPLITLTMFYGSFQSALASLERIFNLLDTQVEVREGTKKIKIRGDIAFENVTFGYEPDKPVLRNLSFKVNRGEVVAIVGPTGSGKTTIANLILKLYEPQEGRILIDGVDLREIELSWLRKHIGLIPQEPVLFSGTVMDNLKIAVPHMSTEEIREKLKKLDLEKFLLKLPEGYDTKVVEGGKNLSVGQRQIVSIARVILSEPSILILDEALSSVDPISEFTIQEVLKRVLQNRTCIIIAHKLSSLRLANRVLVIMDGRIVEEGTHEELIKRGEVYPRLYKAHFALART